MNDLLTSDYINFLKNGELGENILHLVDIIEKREGTQVYVDIGVESGKSSKVLLHGSYVNGTKVYGIDPIPTIGIDGILNHPNYTLLKQDSVVAGREWNNGEVDIAFIDSIHVKPQVMMELYYWWDLVKIDGWLVFHDTEWGMNKPNGYIHKPDHPCAGRKPGNSGLGYDFYAGRGWETPEYAIFDFFKLQDLNVENEYIKSLHYPDSLGMTFIQKKQNFDYKNLISQDQWQKTELERQSILKSFI